MLSQKGRIPLSTVVFFFFGGISLIFIALNLPFQLSLVTLLAAVFFIIAFLKTDIALIIVILSMLLSPELRAGQISSRNVNIRAEDLFIFIIFLGWLAQMAVKKELGLMKRNPLNTPIIIYFTICVISSLLGLIQGRLRFQSSFFFLLKYFEYYLIFFLVSNNLRDYKQAKKFIFFILLTCFIVCCVAWLQLPSGERLSAPFESEGGEPNTFAGYLLLMMSLILGLFFYSKTQKERLFFFGFFALAGVPFLFTLSREAWASFVPMLLAFMAFNRKSRLPLLFFIVVGLALSPFLIPKRVHQRINETFTQEKSYQLFGKKIHVSESFAARIDSWNIAFNKLSGRPFIGYGVPEAGTVDNQYTRVIIETGLIGFSVFIWLIISLFRLAYKGFLTARNDFSKAITLGFICGLVGLLTQSLGAAVFILIRIMEVFWFIAAIVLSLPELEENENAELGETEKGSPAGVVAQ